MYRLFAFIVLIMAASACGNNLAPSDTDVIPPTATAPPLIGGVEITSPQLGSVIYAEVLRVGGTLTGVDRFRLIAETLSGEILYDGFLESEDGRWVVDIVHGYRGEPSELVIQARSTDRRVSLIYDEVTILISSLIHRPEGSSGLILFPDDMQEVGGDAIQVSGVASGVSTNRLTISLKQDDQILDQQVIILDNPYQVDERVWSGDLLTHGFTGRATIEVSYIDLNRGEERLLDTIQIIIGSVAG